MVRSARTTSMYRKYAPLALIAALFVAGCGGGSSSGSSVFGGPVSVAPSSNPANTPLLDTVAGSTAWVDSETHRTLYFLDVDTATGGACTGSCLSLWPFLGADSGALPQGFVSVITRSDGGGKQWAYQIHPLYFYSGDSGPDQANGDGIPQDGGHWHIARPNATRSGGGSGR